MKQIKYLTAFLLCSLSPFAKLQAQATPKTQPDVLIFTDDEKLLGQMQSATDKTITFKSDMAGVVTVEWSKVKELRTNAKFAAIPKGIVLRKLQDSSQIPQGVVSMNDQKLEVTPVAPAAPATLPVANVANVVPQASFEHAFHRQRFTEGWKGGLTVGVAFTESTQTSETFTGAFNLVRTDPGESWIDLRSRTTLDFNEAYGEISQSGQPTVKTALTHFDASQDWYLNPRFFATAGAALDHNYSQGLDLQQTYGGGFGLVVEKTANQELDVKATADFIDQRFQVTSFDKQLFGTAFSETYTRKFKHGILLNEQGGVTPAWNNLNAYSAFASAGLTFPVYHRIGFTLGVLDNFLNDPIPGFKKNSFQLTLGATYGIK